jgi:hypothetical protein
MVTADLHGYTAQYYMAPASRPINSNISGWPNKWNEAVGAGNARAFDAFGWLYYVRDQFDLYYPGYYDTWPSLTGATGATYETDGGPALLKRREDGTLLSLRDGIAALRRGGQHLRRATPARWCATMPDSVSARSATAIAYMWCCARSDPAPTSRRCGRGRGAAPRARSRRWRPAADGGAQLSSVPTLSHGAAAGEGGEGGVEADPELDLNSPSACWQVRAQQRSRAPATTRKTYDRRRRCR